LTQLRSFPGLHKFEVGAYDRALSLLLSVAQDGHTEVQCRIACIYQLRLGSVAPGRQALIELRDGLLVLLDQSQSPLSLGFAVLPNRPASRLVVCNWMRRGTSFSSYILLIDK